MRSRTTAQRITSREGMETTRFAWKVGGQSKQRQRTRSYFPPSSQQTIANQIQRGHPRVCAPESSRKGGSSRGPAPDPFYVANCDSLASLWRSARGIL